MKIDFLEVRGLEYLAGPLHKQRWGGTERACLVSIHAENGDVGHAIGRAHGGMSHAFIHEPVASVLGPALVGRDLAGRGDIETYWTFMQHSHMAQYIPIFAMSVMDVAVWDLLGRTKNVPVSELISKGVEHDRPVYGTLPPFSAIEDAVEFGRKTIGEGFVGLKLPRSGNEDADMRLCRALREILGHDVQLMYDGRRSLELADAQRIGAILADLGFAWFEEPFEPFDTESYRALSASLELPIAGFEAAPGASGAAAWAMELGIFDIVLADCYWKGGITGVLDLLAHADRLGHRVAFHHGGSASMNAANVQVAAGAGITEIVERMVPTSIYDVGYLTAGPAPTGAVRRVGLGLELDNEWVESHTVAGSCVRVTG